VKKIFVKIAGAVKTFWTFLKGIKLRWWFVYAGFAGLVYVHFLGLLGTIGMTVALVLLNKKIHEIGA
jgi:hypothetical protein